MFLFLAMLIAALGTIFIERQLRQTSRAAIRVPVRSNNKRPYRQDKN